MNRFITDMGESLEFKTEGSTAPIWKLGRYGVWDSCHGHKPEVLETSDDLDALQTKYGPWLEVRLLSRGR